MDKYPFVIKVNPNETGYATERDWTYHVTYSSLVVIQPGHVGVVIIVENRIIKPEVLKPGVHRVNLNLFKVEHVDTQRQTYTFGGDAKSRTVKDKEK